MTIVNDPDNLDRFQVVIDPVYRTISLRGSGTKRLEASTGSGDTNGKFVDTSIGGFNTSNGVVADDILAIISDDYNDQGVIGHYKIASIASDEILTLDRTITTTGLSGISYAIYADAGRDLAIPSLSDGVTMQALYSFLKEEWRVNSVSASGEDLIKYTFPMVSITSEQFEIGGVSNSNWEFADDSGDGSLADESPRNLIRTGGWASINTSGQIIENYPSIITLGTLDDDAQVYYQLTSATTNPVDFVLTGPVNQSIRTLETIGGASVDGQKIPVNGLSLSNVTFTAPATITAGVDLFDKGFTSGELIQVRNASNSDNNGLFVIESSGVGATFVTVAERSITTATAADASISPMTDNRDYLVLRVRKKGKTYAQSEIADIGVSQINTIVNRFPLSHIDDPAIVLFEGQLAGDDTATTLNIQSVESHTTGSDGATSASLAADGTFTLTAGATPSPAFNDGILNVGDSISLAGSGFFEIKSIDAADTLTLFYEPTGIQIGGVATPYQGGDSAVVFNTFTSTVDTGGASAGTFNWTADDTVATLDDAGKTFNSDDGLGDRLVASGDILEVYASSTDENTIGYYKVYDVVDADTLTVLAKDLQGYPAMSSETVSYRVRDAGMFLQYKSISGTQVVNPTVTDGDTLTDASFTSDSTNGYYKGGVVTITGADVSADNGTYIITNDPAGSIDLINVDGTTATLTSTTLTVDTSFGFIRDQNGVDYSFNWRLFGNNGTLAECFQFLQRELRRTTDIDGSNGTSRGDITDLLMSFVAPNATTLNLFIDDVNPAEKNNLTSQDSTGNNRNFPFTVTLRISSNANITNAASKKIVVFFSDNDGTPGNDDEFGTPGATIVPQSNGSDMVVSDGLVTAVVDFEYNYTEGGGIDRDITVVCITTNTGQYVQATATLEEENVVPVSLVAGLERNYSNP